MKKKLFVFCVIIVIIIVVLVIFRSISKNKNTKKQPLRTALVERGNIVVKVTESGRVEPVTTVNIKSELAGEVKKLFVEEGDSVKVGEKLALVQQESSQAQQVAQARASLERAKLDLEDAKRNLERKQELYRKGFIAKKDVEDAEKLYKNSKIQYELAEKQLWLVLGRTEPIKAQSLASKALDNIIIRAPISGVVISLNVEEGEMITSGTRAFGGGGTTLMTIGDLSKMIVKVDINEVDVTKVKVGQPVNIGFDAIKGRVYHGRVKRISPAGTIKQNIVVYPVEVEILGSSHGERQISVTERELPTGQLFAQLTEEQRATIRREVQSLRKQGTSREEIRNAIRKKLREYGVTPPVSRPQPTPPLSQQVREQLTGIELIKPGMTADLDIIIGKAENVLCVPKEAIIEKDGQKMAMSIKKGKPVLQPVVTGLEDDVKVEIKEGLKEGDKVVITGFERQLFERASEFMHRGPPR
ncbi:MAG TPA: efflux RND transporter periplasmic adaptor subunit [bacterium (Candidatus Stahlbacteria)]|nr:efflux RND transporter periplasmic adaptor subunit [Candidatus Stahlbacteria bacterium]